MNAASSRSYAGVADRGNKALGSSVSRGKVSLYSRGWAQALFIRWRRPGLVIWATRPGKWQPDARSSGRS